MLESPFRVIEVRNNRKPMRISMSFIVTICFSIFYRFRDIYLLVKNLRFSPFLTVTVSFEALATGFRWDLGYEG